MVLHQKALYPALGELAKNYREEKSEETVLIAEAAVHVNAYPDQDVRTPFERLLLGKYDENALRPYRGANCVEMLCKQGYTEEQAAKIADRMPRINADTYELERGARLAVAQENIHYLSEYYLWEELLTSPDKAVGRLAMHMQGSTGNMPTGSPSASGMPSISSCTAFALRPTGRRMTAACAIPSCIWARCCAAVRTRKCWR